MEITIWAIQVLTALGFVYSGWLKAFQYKKAKASWGWVSDVPQLLVILIGVAELGGAVGLILPEAMKRLEVLTPIAATALAAVVLMGAFFHLSRREYKEIGVNAVFFALAVFVALARF